MSVLRVLFATKKWGKSALTVFRGLSSGVKGKYETKNKPVLLNLRFSWQKKNQWSDFANNAPSFQLLLTLFFTILIPCFVIFLSTVSSPSLSKNPWNPFCWTQLNLSNELNAPVVVVGDLMGRCYLTMGCLRLITFSRKRGETLGKLLKRLCFMPLKW